MSCSSATEFWRQKILKVAKDFKDVTFAIASEEEYEDKLKDLGLDDSGEEINIGCFDDKGRKYKMEPDDEFSEDSLREFIEEFKAGKYCDCYRFSFQATKNQIFVLTSTGVPAGS